MYIFRFIIFFLFTLIASPILAASDEHHHHDDEEQLFEEHTSHVHGHANAQVSFDKGVLNINITLSSIDIFGFEHLPKNDEQKDIITQAVKVMETAENLFGFTNELCEHDSVKIESELIESETNDHEDHHDGHEDEHHQDEELEDESHTDVLANYSYICNTETLESIEYLIFNHFPSLEQIEVQYIANDHQALFNATPSNRIQKLN